MAGTPPRFAGIICSPDDSGGPGSGALDYASGQVAWCLQEHKDGAGFAQFLERIAQTWPGDDLALVMDNVSDHRTAVMRAWWAAQNGRIVPFWLPAYAPNLNLIERV